jgi:hypothetical protein
MTTASASQLELKTPPVAQQMQTRSLIVGVIFSAISLIFAFMAPDQFFHAYLIGYMLWLGMSLGCLAWLMIQYMTGGAWGMVIRRPLEAGTKVLPLMAALFVPLIPGMKYLYVWSRPEDVAKSQHLKDITATYLSTNFWIARAVLYFLIWIGLSLLLNRYSAEQDSAPEKERNPQFKRISAPGLIIFTFAVAFAAIDWVMSIDPQWISTMYPLVFVAGQCLSAMCMMVVVERILSRYKPMSELLHPTEVHDHGKLILAFLMLWAYFGFSQLLIIWAGNLPEEIPFYRIRLFGGWQGVGLFLFIFHFAIPFLILLSRPFKRDPRQLALVASWLIFMRAVDLYWYIEPNFHQSFHVTLADIVVPIGIGGLWLSFYFRNLRSRPLIAAYDPNIQKLFEPSHGH